MNQLKKYLIIRIKLRFIKKQDYFSKFYHSHHEKFLYCKKLVFNK